jgi:hypothetical protein
LEENYHLQLGESPMKADNVPVDGEENSRALFTSLLLLYLAAMMDGGEKNLQRR